MTHGLYLQIEQLKRVCEFQIKTRELWDIIHCDIPRKSTKPKPVGHGYVFSMAVGTIGEWLKVVPFFVRGQTVDFEGGGGSSWPSNTLK